jgi:methylated-DNA-[protein]-cysteine S-methyltransferase
MSNRTPNDRPFFIERIATPTGPMLLLTDAQERLRALDWEDHEERMQRRLARNWGADVGWLESSSGRASKAHRAVQAYFAGELSALEALDVHTGGTQFQREVWVALRAIPVGETTSYGRLAATIGRPRAVRAVGLANGANPIALVVPCHRVIGADATLTGYGGGIERKRWLLEHEGVHLEAPRARRRPRPTGQAAFAYA